jgi:hypothetical protein
LVAVALVALTGCDKPAPSATVFSGADSTRVEALCWSFDAAAQLNVRRCLSQGEGQSAAQLAESLRTKVGVVPVLADQTIGISVDPAITEYGWYPVIGNARLTEQPLTDTYFRFQLSASELRSGSVELRVLALGSDPNKVRGLWLFELRPPRSDTATPTPSPTGTKS